MGFSSLLRYFHHDPGKVEVGKRQGPPPILRKDEEQCLVNWAVEMNKIGYGQTRQQIYEIVKKSKKRMVGQIPLKKTVLAKIGGMLFWPEIILLSGAPLPLKCIGHRLVLSRIWIGGMQILSNSLIVTAFWMSQIEFETVMRVVFPSALSQVECWLQWEQRQCILLALHKKDK